MKEEWKDIEGYENYYIISNTGKIKSLLTNKLLALSDVNNMGYKRVTLYKPVKKRFFVHRLVAYHFCEDYSEDLVVNHKDGNKQNNNADNLEWVAHSENDIHAYKNNLRHVSGGAIIQQKMANRRVIVTSLETNQVEFIFDNYKECAKSFGLNEVYIQHCCLGKYKLKRTYKVCYEEMA